MELVEVADPKRAVAPKDSRWMIRKGVAWRQRYIGTCGDAPPKEKYWEIHLHHGTIDIRVLIRAIEPTYLPYSIYLRNALMRSNK